MKDWTLEDQRMLEHDFEVAATMLANKSSDFDAAKREVKQRRREDRRLEREHNKLPPGKLGTLGWHDRTKKK